MPRRVNTSNLRVVEGTPIDIDATNEGLDLSLSREDLRRSVNRGRMYVWPPTGDNPRSYISVTNALGAIPKKALVYWAAKEVANAAVSKYDLLGGMIEDNPEDAVKWLKGAPWGNRDRAADMGTAIHSVAELDAEGQSGDADEIIASLPPDAQAKARQVRDCLDRLPVRIEHTEAVVYSDDYGYAGTLDFIVSTDDEELLSRLPHEGTAPDGRAYFIADLKTGKGVYPEVALQLAAYRHATHMVDLANVTRVDVPEVHGGFVIHPTEKSWAIIPVACGIDAFRDFLSALTLSRSLPLSEQYIGSAAMRGRAK